MPDFRRRSYQPEMMDAPNVDTKLLHKNLRELETINILTGGPRLTFDTLKKLLKGTNKKEITIVDVGYGAGDFLSYVVKHAHQLPCQVKLIGVDYSPLVKAYIDTYHPELLDKVEFITADYRDYFRQGQPMDIVTAGLFCHHLNDEELGEFLSFVRQYARVGAIINDLHRHKVAYYGIKYLTAIFSSSVFTQNDAPLSVLRGFTQKEWKDILTQAQIYHSKIDWRWAFRHLITIKNGE